MSFTIVPNKLYQTPLLIAILKGFDGIARTMIQNRDVGLGQPDQLGMPPLTLAVHHKRDDIVRLMIQAGASPHGPETGDPILAALSQRNMALLTDLLHALAFYKDLLHFPTGQMLCTATRCQDTALFRAIIEFDTTEVNWHDGSGQTAFCWAATGRQDMVRMLLATPNEEHEITWHNLSLPLEDYRVESHPS
ncbi:uncharacterized protein N7459_002369 [Penicillium hispanicum]|uniref:uncharacterized protein n=1 Tax=Penicillium hispanicum TaxID=1080232 RepID=UPI0025403FB2|nr:uncharacterized protein N7459_002369 [Penicillium hispanicum]KAJ5592000.1 hypothetical protein N7459_002369 [Penicillium hispanicum]